MHLIDMDKKEHHDEILRLGYSAGKTKHLMDKYPYSNSHPLFVHGWMMGKSDLLCSMKVIKFPFKTAQESREIYNYIKAVLEDEECDSDA